eukprot:scaffold411825_cov16-Prasinocladus_malaysianus.AAC.1
MDGRTNGWMNDCSAKPSDMFGSANAQANAENFEKLTAPFVNSMLALEIMAFVVSMPADSVRSAAHLKLDITSLTTHALLLRPYHH